MNRRGQVFLVAAIILTGILLTLTRFANKITSKDEPDAFYDLSDEIDFEVRKVLDYGVISGGQNTRAIISELINNYSDYIADEDVVFVYGNAMDVSAVYYQSINNLQAISLGSIYVPVNVVLASQTPVIVKPLDQVNVAATITINSIDYVFNLKPGQNFYFVLIKEEDGEKYVAIQ
jgi:hypothetical protein